MNEPSLSTKLVKRSVTLGGHRTSIALEPAFWEELERLADTRGMKLVRLIAEVDASRPADAPLTSSLRLAVLESLRSR